MAIMSDVEALKTIDKLVLEVKVLLILIVVIPIIVVLVSIKVSVLHCDNKDPKPDLVELSKDIRVGDMVTHRMDGWDGMVISTDGPNMNVRIHGGQYMRQGKSYGIEPVMEGLAVEWEKAE